MGMDLHHSYIDCMGIVVDDSKLSDDVSKKKNTLQGEPYWTWMECRNMTLLCDNDRVLYEYAYKPCKKKHLHK